MTASRSTLATKRLLDIVIAAIGLVLFSPLLLATAVLVRIKLGSPVLFTQVRPGLQGRPFRMLKFRSMTDARDAAGALLPDAERLTRFGSFVRASSLDELPEMWNVLRGDMSLIGPRPLLMEYLPLYSAAQARRHEVRPGISGWAQINGRNALDWNDKFELDVWYVDNLSIGLDVRIFFLTFARLLRSEGITAPRSATAEKFTGSPQ